MTQYCRYCGRACLVDDDLFHCSKKDKIFYGAKAKRPNTCKDFAFIEFDLFNPDKQYSARQGKVDDGYTQTSIFDKGD